ncbi:hypothetical protein [Streptomyces sp. wa22]|uniref:hypothetical protein n=1 Tax=Streptomyces sp. wa22 TaxID=1828244 RepID=UPI0011C7CA64|nr:hypothetical protein [Streptomyces sp. wa22]TXS10339.1 hypothetical protein EAO68_26435 [Streptomyces sp. wa22]
MRLRTTTAAIVAVLAVTLVGCSSDEGGETEADATRSTVAEPSSASDDSASDDSASDDSGSAESAGIPPEPTGAERDAVLAAIRDVNGNLTHDEDKAVDAARNQCSSLDGGGSDPDHSAAQRFSYDGVTLTDDDGRHINIGLRKTLCPQS